MEGDTARLPLREATEADVGALVALVNSAYRGESAKAGWTHESDLLGGIRTDDARMRATLRDPNAVLLVHEDGAELLACVLLEKTDRGTAYLGMLTVRPTLQAGGLGRRLLAGAEAYARDRWKVSAVEMTVITLRTELIAWYERRGYVRTAERRPFPDDPTVELRRDGIEFVVLTKAL